MFGGVEGVKAVRGAAVARAPRRGRGSGDGRLRSRRLRGSVALARFARAPGVPPRAVEDGGGAPRAGAASRLRLSGQGAAGRPRAATRFDLPDNWEIDLRHPGEGGANDLEVKLVDASGDNVWWAVRREFVPPAGWTPVRLKKRHFSFAWGPAAEETSRHAAAIEVAVTARAGGRGWIAIEALRLTALPVRAVPRGGLRGRAPLPRAPAAARTSPSIRRKIPPGGAGSRGRPGSRSISAPCASSAD